MNNKKLKVNTDSMLGFRLVNSNTAEKTVNHKLGSKIGEKTRAGKSPILGSKIGGKPLKS